MIFPPLETKNYPNSSQVRCHYHPLCIWNKEGIGRFKAPDGVELYFIAKTTQPQQLEYGERLGVESWHKN